MIIKGKNIFIDHGFTAGAVEFDDKITGIYDSESAAGFGTDLSAAQRAGEIIDAGEDYVIPGFVDIHTHGGAGGDFSDGSIEGNRIAAAHYAAHGVTSFLATTMTIPEVEIIDAVTAIKQYKDEADKARDIAFADAQMRGLAEARCMGVHLEGPFLSKAKKGAQAESALHSPDAALWHRFNDASGNIVRMVTVAPEEPGGIEFVKEVSKYCAVSVGHTACDYETAMAAYEAGASHATHLFNGMPSLHHRNPGPIAAAMDSGASAELICDGLHINPAIIRLTYKLFGDKLNLISDSLRCAGLPDGDYELGGQPIHLSGGVARLKGTDTLAGSAITVHDAVKNVVRFGLPLEAAIYAATAAPALAAGIAGEKSDDGGKDATAGVGIFAPGNYADILILDKNLDIKAVYIGGKRL